ncbi:MULTISPECIES: hypothetical protein [Vallitalea]|uniref:Uncharacterized protein n=1 Tax=Vallitalea maricola TaxID=3074433 RepID=A0ACB5UEL5_9FIRM|nr:hypothetical protein [Vallitalea guaymasensis]GMQ61186.1 hypothetical protein AN2V17_04140 [Vallitalea sp. AN17-2]
MEKYIFDVIMVVVGLLVSGNTYFMKRTLNNFEKKQGNNSNKIEELEGNFNNYKLNNNKETEEGFKKLIDTINSKMDMVQKEITAKIDTIESKNENQVRRLQEQQEKLSKEIYTFREHVARNYTKQEDFSSETRDINKKLDSVYGVVKNIEGFLQKK